MSSSPMTRLRGASSGPLTGVGGTSSAPLTGVGGASSGQVTKVEEVSLPLQEIILPLRGGNQVSKQHQHFHNSFS